MVPLAVVLCLPGLLACRAAKLGGSDGGGAGSGVAGAAGTVAGAAGTGAGGGVAGAAGTGAGGAAGAAGTGAGGGVAGAAGTGAGGVAGAAGTGAGGLGGSGQPGGSGGQVYRCFGSFGGTFGGGGSAGSAGSGGGGSGGATVFCPTTDTPPTDAAALRVYQLVEAKQHANLQRVVGQYACGTSPLYRGTFAASDNLGSLGAGYSNGVITSGPVIASLETTSSSNDFLTCTQTVMGVRALVVMATAQSEAIRLFQVFGGDASTYASLVTVPGSSWTGTSGSCAACVSDLRTGSPQTISIGSATLNGQFCYGQPLTVSVSGQLAIVAQPSFDDIMEINQSFGDHLAPPPFASEGPDMVTTIDDALYEPIPTMSGCAGSERVTPYHVDWYVNRQNVELLGLRNFRVDPPQNLCCIMQI
jgi:hypothetical protein